MSGLPLLRLEDVSTTASARLLGGGSRAAVRAVSFDVTARRVVALVGESGSGKHTIGRLILRRERPMSGRVLLSGEDTTRLCHRARRDYEREVQGVCSCFSLRPGDDLLSAHGIFMALHRQYFRTVPPDQWQERVDAALAAVGLDAAELPHRPLHELSRAQHQRLRVARAIALRARLLVVDDLVATAARPADTDLQILLANLRAEGLAVLVLTDDLAFSHSVADDMVILRRGEVVEAGATAQVVGDPRHPYTRALVRATIGRAPRAAVAGGTGRGRGAPSSPRAPAPGARNGTVDASASRPAPQLVEVEPGHRVADSLR